METICQGLWHLCEWRMDGVAKIGFGVGERLLPSGAEAPFIIAVYVRAEARTIQSQTRLRLGGIDQVSRTFQRSNRFAGFGTGSAAV